MAVSGRMIRENLLQSRTISSLKRVGSELIARLKSLSREELGFLARASYGDLNAIVWVAVCRTYPLIADFAVEVVRDAYMMGRPAVTLSDYDHFAQRQASLHPELDQVSDQTRGKIRQVVFKMIVDAGYMTKKHEVVPAVLSPDVLALLPESDLLLFPMYVAEGALS